MSQRVLVVAAHPDDEVLGMGGTIARHVRRGDEVTVLWVTDGSSTQYPGRPDLLARKYREAEQALAELGGCASIRGELPDMRLDALPHVEVNQVVEQAVTGTGAQVVYCVHPDVNRDHRAVFESVAVATRPRPGTTVRRVLTYAALSSNEWTPAPHQTFVPTWFTDITEDLVAKQRAFACYRTEAREWPHPRSARAITAAAEHWGCSVGVAAAEPFLLVREIEG
ncbi:LmbE family N-acetylglucosaminyl deacetylase [Crossiella equi]|uniref:LmbE family N-acetylglucosaminyl deacetylase n=1 Tax=Crossiella equi TaxID=130796 RepID=A0ABS5A5Q2_9PSEU|nr:PIG-L deacetylase family protein [Crossiella equi]MBP2471915.1 LmbE family N-acetylglucosaminyl deacetylase [Crossiella equi]